MSLLSISHLAYRLIIATAVVTFLFLCEAIATQEFFKADDYYFLSRVSAADFSWQETFWPVNTDRHFAFRPIGETAYFWLGYQLFGLEAFGFFQLSLLVQLASGALAFRIARQINLNRAVAVTVGLASASGMASMHIIWYGVGFSYLLAAFLAALSLTFFLDHLETPSRPRLGLSALAYAASLTCHEACLALPLVLFGFSLMERPGQIGRKHRLEHMRSITPHLLIMILFVIYRFWIITPIIAEPGTYDFSLSPIRAALRLWNQIIYAAGGPTLFWVSAFFIGSLSAMIALGRSDQREPLKAFLLPRLALITVWILLMIGPSLTIMTPTAPRYSVHIEIPLCLMLGVLVQGAWQASLSRFRPAIEVAFMIFVLVSVPWQMLVSMDNSEDKPFARNFIKLAREQLLDSPVQSRIVLLHGAPGLASPMEMYRFHWTTYGGRPLVQAALPELDVRYGLINLEETPRPVFLSPESRYVLIQEGLSFSLPDEAYLIHHLIRPNLDPGRPRLFKAASSKLVHLQGLEAIPLLRQVCASQDSKRAEKRCLRWLARHFEEEALPQHRELIAALLD